MPDFDPDRLPRKDTYGTNPYAPPDVEFGGRLRAPSPGALGHVEPFSIDAVIRRAWRIFQDNMGIAIAIFVGVAGISFGFSFGIGVLLAGAERAMAAGPFLFVQVVLMLAQYALQLFLTAGQTVALLKLAQGRQVRFDEVFQGGRYVVRLVLATLLLFLFMFPLVILCVLPAAVGAGLTTGAEPVIRFLVIGLGALIGIVAFIAVAARFYQYPYVLVDRDCGVVECLSASYQITKGHVLEVVGLGILASLIGISGILLCVVGLLFSIPLSMLIQTCTYVCLVGDTGRPEVVLEKPPPADPDFIDFTH